MRFLVSTLLVFACTSAFADKMEVPESNKIYKKGILTFGVEWVKDKGGKFDVHVKVHNENDENGMIILLSDLGCKRGDTKGELKYTFFNTGERTIDFKPGQSKEFNMVCKMKEKATGKFILTIDKVYDNPSMDGKTVKKILAKNLTWSQADGAGDEKGSSKSKTETKDDTE